MKRYNNELTADELAALPDEEIDHSNILELDEDFWANADVVEPEPREHESPRVCWRLPTLRDWSHEQSKTVFP